MKENIPFEKKEKRKQGLGKLVSGNDIQLYVKWNETDKF